MNLAAIKQRLEKIKPFVVYEFYGVENCLAENNKPLSVCVTPPNTSFIIESGHITTLILRYSETYRSQVENAEKLNQDDKKSIAQKAMSEISEKIKADPKEQAEQIAMLSKLGREFLTAKAIYAYHEDEKDKVKVYFVDDIEAANEVNKTSPNELVIPLDALTDMELIRVGMELISALPNDDPANIPFLEKDEEGGETVSTAPADAVAKFPRNTRSIIVEDVSEPSRD